MERYANHPALKAVRRDLRNHATHAEAALWRMLQRRQLKGRKFRRQHSIGHYVLDFYCPAERLAVELDGNVHDDPARAAYDAKRQAALEALGVRVLRFRNDVVLETPDLVVAAIAASFQASE
ncbi:MAG: endonuclease domain-containing protein [Bacteroidota bacterium]